MPHTLQLETFAREAHAFCRWATGEDGSTMTVLTALRHITSLYKAGLELPLPSPPTASRRRLKRLLLIAVPLDSGCKVMERVDELPVQVYCEIFDPLAQPPKEPVMITIREDIGEIYQDVARGLVLFDAGDYKEAWRMWASHFSHWGEHATGSIRALHAYLAKQL